MRSELIGKVVETLESHGFNVLLYSCAVMDIAAQRKKLSLLIKVIENIDSLKQDQTAELKNLSASLDATPILIGACSKQYSTLSDDVVYNRYGMSAMTLTCFESSLEDVFPAKFSSKGRDIVEIRGNIMQEERESQGFTRKALAEKVGVTKDAIYMYEKGMMKMQSEVAEQLERLLGARIVVQHDPFKQTVSQFVSHVPETELQQKLMVFDFEVTPFSKTKFDILAKDNKEKFIIKEGAKDISDVVPFSDFFKTILTVVSDKKSDVLAISEKDLLNVDSKKEFVNMLKERSLS